ncbi:NAD(P)-dependent oxidoreductase [Caulobacter sp. FWC2]|uniref:NAD-dependent epimerase/dehydratase family protein n=1 Tax=Caulobacter sp. FWC2 TaxID=69664 RepID=UPI000C15CFD3|nr:NAD(P)-dependent oxidoreductase [Caulobacter sp. FWC2]PIB91622.1 3-beta hydroxysteroid dehydrogenase [Caulobacter sp. FWC2]
MLKNRTLVFGASGFIGTRLVSRLAAAGHEVEAVDILPPRQRIDGVTYSTHDVRHPLPVEIGRGVSTIFNLAAVHRTPGHPDSEYFETNVAGALNVAQLATDCAIKTIVFTSSISVYGPSENVLDEQSPLNPVSAYGKSKRLAEIVHQQWAQVVGDRRLVIVRPGVVFGPGERGNYSYLAKALSKGYFLYPGRKDTVKSGGYVDELLRTFDFALERYEKPVLYNFAYPDESSIQDIVTCFQSIMERKAKPATVPLPLLMTAAGTFEQAAKLGVKTPIHRERVLKLVRSTKISPGWLKSQDYAFSTNLKTALEAWKRETEGTFV